MSEIIKIKNGLNINLLGEAEKIITEAHPKKCAIKPIDFVGVFPKLMVKEGDEVKAGTPLFFDKYREDIIFTAPVSGKVTEIRRGAKRVLLEIVVEADGRNDFLDFGKASPATLSREEIVARMLQSGVWPLIRQRPYSIIAEPKAEPKAIFISAFDTAPLAPDFDLILHSNEEPFQAGLDILAKLTSGKVHLNLDTRQMGPKIWDAFKGVRINYFSGKHPSGNVGTQIAHLDPINKGDIVWYLRPQEVIAIGRLFLTGKIDNTRLIAFSGSEVVKPRYIRTLLGSSIEEIVKDGLKTSNVRYISGNALSGKKIEFDGFVGYYDNQITVLPEGDHYEFIGWALPGLNKFSYSHTFLSWITPHKRYALDTNLNGAERAYVMTGKYEKVFGWDIYPLELIKATIIEDIDLMEKLGIYEVDEEDFALCEFIDTSKTEIQAIIRHGLDLMRKEMS